MRTVYLLHSLLKDAYTACPSSSHLWSITHADQGEVEYLRAFVRVQLGCDPQSNACSRAELSQSHAIVASRQLLHIFTHLDNLLLQYSGRDPTISKGRRGDQDNA